MLVFYFEKKCIIEKKSAFYIKDQENVAKLFIYTIIEIVCTMYINAKL